MRALCTVSVMFRIRKKTLPKNKNKIEKYTSTSRASRILTECVIWLSAFQDSLDGLGLYLCPFLFVFCLYASGLLRHPSIHPTHHHACRPARQLPTSSVVYKARLYNRPLVTLVPTVAVLPPTAPNCVEKRLHPAGAPLGTFEEGDGV